MALITIRSQVLALFACTNFLNRATGIRKDVPGNNNNYNNNNKKKDDDVEKESLDCSDFSESFRRNVLIAPIG